MNPLDAAANNREDAERSLTQLWSRPPGWRGVISAVNNQPIGKRYMLTSLAFFVIAGLMSLLLRAQLTVSDAGVLGPEFYNQIFTMHGSTMMYLFAVPFVEGLALYLVPMMIGSRDVAFPRLTNFGYWMYLFGGLTMYASFAVGQVPDAGWFSYTPLSGPGYAGIGLDFWLLGLGLVEIAGLTAALEIVVTILKFRAPGMAIYRMPLLAWSFLVAGVMILFGFTPLLMATLLLEMDRTVGTQFFNAQAGGSSLLWQHLFWFFGHPEVYIIFIPATGVVSTIVPAFARRPIVGYTLIVTAIIIIGFVSFGLWVHHMFTTGLPEVSLLFFAAASFMVALGSGVQIFAWIATLWRSRPRYDTPLLYVLGFIFIFVLGGLTGVMVATLPFDWQVHDTYFVVAHFHYVLIGGAVFPIFAGLHYWAPKITGRIASETIGRIAFWLVFLGFNATFFPMHIMGFFGMPRRTYTYSSELGLDGYNITATVGAGVLAVGFALALANLLYGAIRGRQAGKDPWDGGTLEWVITSPAPTYSFARPIVVTSRYPAWEAEEGAEQGAAVQRHDRLAIALDLKPQRWRATLVTSAVEAEPQALQALPGPTPLPFVAAVACLITASGVLMQSYSLAAVAAAIATLVFMRWMWQGPKPDPNEEEQLLKSTGLALRTHGATSTVWWGMIGLLAILGTALGALVFSYFYLRLYAEQWPQGDQPLAHFAWHTAAAGALVASGLCQAWTSWSWRSGHKARAIITTAATTAIGLGSALLFIIAALQSGIDPTANAYGSAYTVLAGFAVVLALIGSALHIATLLKIRIAATGGGTDELPWQVGELFWAFVVAAGLITYLTICASAHLL